MCPVYEYQCEDCDNLFTKKQKITDKNIPSCPKCKGKSKKLISISSFMLKGGGWFSDGYSKGYEKSKNKKEE